MPDWKRELRARLAPLGLAPARQEDIAEELAQHLDARVDDLIRNGFSAEDAARVAEGRQVKDGVRTLVVPGSPGRGEWRRP